MPPPSIYPGVFSIQGITFLKPPTDMSVTDLMTKLNTTVGVSVFQ